MIRSRHRLIQELLYEHGECSVEQLARECKVSLMTIRRDLHILAELGLVARSHGGAAPLEQVTFQFEFHQRSKQNEKAKQLIARTAAAMVTDGQSVMLDSGTTTLALALQLRDRKRLQLITTSLAIASALQKSSGVQVLLLGGFVRHDAPDLAGIVTEMNLEHLQADWAFIGADGIDLEGNIYNASIELCRMLSKMVSGAKTAYIVSDSSKIGRTALMRFGNIASCQGLITDAGIEPNQQIKLSKAGVNIIISKDLSSTSNTNS